MGKETLSQQPFLFLFFLKRYRQLETHARWQSYPVSFGGGEKGKPQRVRQQGGNIPRAHSTCHLTPPPLFRAPPPRSLLFLRFQKPDARARRRGETLSPGEFSRDERQLTLDVEGGVGGAELLARGRVAGHAHEVAGVQLPVHGDELEVTALQEAALAALQAAAVVEPAVRHVGRVADLAAQHGAAPVQGVLGLGLPGELDGGGGAGGQNCWGRRRERGKVWSD